jgi:hypothetical protein
MYPENWEFVGKAPVMSSNWRFLKATWPLAGNSMQPFAVWTSSTPPRTSLNDTPLVMVWVGDDWKVVSSAIVSCHEHIPLLLQLKAVNWDTIVSPGLTRI